ncbi:MAG: IclR family transcriptional regulator domain-containing protein [Paracoccaceae bacterium]
MPRMGAIILAMMPRDRAKKLTEAEWARRAAAGVWSEFAPLLERVEATGIAWDREEHTPGISAMGFAFVDWSGDLHAISVPVPASQFERIEKIARQGSGSYQPCASKLIAGVAAPVPPRASGPRSITFNEAAAAVFQQGHLSPPPGRPQHASGGDHPRRERYEPTSLAAARKITNVVCFVQKIQQGGRTSRFGSATGEYVTFRQCLQSAKELGHGSVGPGMWSGMQQLV